MVTTFILVLLFRLVMWNYFDGMQFPNQELRAMEPSGAFKDFAEYRLADIGQFLFWFVLAPYLLLVSYFKLKEREI